MSENSRELLTVEQVAEILGIAPVSVRRHAELGSLPAPVRIGRIVRWKRSDIARWLQAQ